jgi:hypothetical protein
VPLPHVPGRERPRHAAVGAIMLALVATGCGGGAGGGAAPATTAAPPSAITAPSTASDRSQAVCSTWVDSDAAAASVLLHTDFASVTPERLQAIVKDLWSTQEPILASMDPAPDQIRPDVEKLLAVARQGAATGDPATLSSPDLKNSDRNIDQYMLQQCGYASVHVTATDNAYQGLPGTMPAGTVGITLSNQGTEAHQVLLSRANDGVTQSFAEILNLPPEQELHVATALGSAEADPGETSTVFLRLTPGRYGAADFVTQGTTRLVAPGSGPPHYSLGIQREFTVT